MRADQASTAPQQWNDTTEFGHHPPPETWTADRVLTIVDETDQLILLE